MSQLSYVSLTDGDQPLAAGFNSRFLLAINLINSGIEADNIASNAITTAKIINDAVTTAKLAHPVLFEKSSDIASATTTDLSTATGNAADITGTTTITAFGTVQSGAMFQLRFTGALILTHNATSLILPTGANITTAAGDTAVVESLGSGNWVLVSYQRKDGTPLSASGSGASIKTVMTKDATLRSTTSVIPYDNSKPQWTGEGTEYADIATTITPSNASNTIIVDFCISSIRSSSGGAGFDIGALFWDAGTGTMVENSILAVANVDNGSFGSYSIHGSVSIVAGSTNATLFKFRFGLASASGTLYINTNQGTVNNAVFGGVGYSYMRVTEIKA